MARRRTLANGGRAIRFRRAAGVISGTFAAACRFFEHQRPWAALPHGDPTHEEAAHRDDDRLGDLVRRPGADLDDLAHARAEGGSRQERAAAGANSFTEGQAKSRLEANGYSNVSGLKKDENGVWKGMATHAGAKVNVSVDYRGNIVRN